MTREEAIVAAISWVRYGARKFGGAEPKKNARAVITELEKLRRESAR